jgi:hypothetical protein
VRAKWVFGPEEQWLYTDLPVYSSEGIDWNCSGVIDNTPVSANINGDGGEGGWNAIGSATETISSTNDWAMLPGHAGTGCFILRNPGTAFPADYLRLIGNRDCRVGSVGSGMSSLIEPREQHAPASNEARTEVALSTPEKRLLPRVEICDGRNNTGADVPDRGCSDRDQGGTVDAIDNCPDTPNGDQADLNGNFIGDACEAPQVDALFATYTKNGVWLQWTATKADVSGFSILRENLGDGSMQRIGGFPATQKNEYVDAPPAGGKFRYVVRAINGGGTEAGSAEVIVTAAEETPSKP